MNNEENYIKYWIIYFGLITSFGILFVSIFKLMIIKHEYYFNLARDNKIMESIIPASRGDILDRKGRVLGKSVYQYFKIEDGNKLYESAGEFRGYKFEGKDVDFELKRQYPYGSALGLITGYVSRATENDLKTDKCNKGIKNIDVVGRTGIESYLNCDLTGINGRRLIEIDARGKYVRELGREEPIKGKDLILSIDAYWQEKIYKLTEGKKVAVVMSEPDTGKIIALVSNPSFDPNMFSFDQNYSKINEYLNDNDGLPMLNRATGAKYHPGSVFKMVLATAGLESGVFDKNTVVEDTGFIKVGEYLYRNWLWTKNGGTDGMVDMIKALKKSNDIYFYRLGEKLGIDRIKSWSNKFGYGAKTGIELPAEIEGIVPDEKWKKEVKGENWYLGNTYHTSIGQGDLGVSPIQVNQMTNIIANNGDKCKMSLLKDSKIDCNNIGVKQNNLNTIIEGMVEACNSGGTAWPLFNFKTQLACKTGTAEVGDGSKNTHAWLTAFGPVDNPEISITVFVERGGEGSDVAAPIVGDILKDWFNEPDTLVPRYKDVGVGTS